MNFYKAIIQYKGTAYHGWQIQNSEKTIQGEINFALKKITKDEEVKTIGSGRTDAGVHAFNQVCKIETKLSINPENFLKALNSNLPEDIRVINIERCDEKFHPIFSAVEKEYLYIFTNKRNQNPFEREFMVNVDWDLDFIKMKKACDLLIGEKDFCNFFCVGTDTQTTVRKIFNCSLENIETIKNQNNVIGQFFTNDIYIFKISGNGFLKQMVRLLMGAIWEVGRQKVTLEEFGLYLQGVKKDKKLAAVAPPHGLYLNKVTY